MKQEKIRKSFFKKAVLSEPVVLIGMFFLAILFFGAFFLLSSKAEDPDKPARKEFESLNQNIMLLSYLSAPVDITGISNVADLIILTVEDEKYLPELKKISEKILTPHFEKPYFWGVHVSEEEDEKLKFYEKRYESVWGYYPVETFEQDIPNLGKLSQSYTVKLIKWED